MTENLYRLLNSADPLAGSEPSSATGEIVGRMSARARSMAARSEAPKAAWWKRRAVMMPVGIVGALALTGAAVAIPLENLGWWINDTKIEKFDVAFPISYTTDTGVEVNCQYGYYFGDPANRTEADERLAAFVADHDWSGLGERIYAAAMANPFVPGPDDDWQVDTQEIRDTFSYMRAAGDVIGAEIPDHLFEEYQSWVLATDCEGRLR